MDECKKQGDACVKDGKYIEAVLHYTKAVKLQPKDATLYSNRSLAFLKMDQHYHAYQDALNVIQIKPNWTKGYYRKGTVEFATEHFSEAICSYKQGLALDPGNSILIESITKATSEHQKQITNERRIPLFGVALGLTICLFVVLGDEVAHQPPWFQNFLFKFLVVLAGILTCYSLAIFYRRFIQSQRKCLLEAPIDLFPEFCLSDNAQNLEPSTRSEAKKSQ